MKNYLIIAFLLFSPLIINAQLWVEDFDGTNTTNLPYYSKNCGDNNDYFSEVCSNGGGCAIEVSTDFTLNSVSGSYFGVRDMDASPCSGSLLDTMRFSNIDISSCTPSGPCGVSNVLYVCFTVAESRNIGGNAGNEWSTSNNREDTWDGDSYVYLKASIDGGSYMDVTAIQAFDGSDTRPGIDVNCNGTSGDPGEPELTSTFTNYCFELPTAGSLLNLEFDFGFLNTGGEDVAIDDIEVYCTGNTATLPGTLLDACTPYSSDILVWLENFDGSNTGNSFDFGPCSATASKDYLGIVCEDGGGCPNEINSDFDYINDSGQFFGVRDMDSPCGQGDVTATLTGVDISGCTEQLYMCFDVAESNSVLENNSSGNFDSWDGNSSVTILTCYDGSTPVELTSIESSSGGDSVPAFDTGCDEGDGEGPVVTSTFTTYCFAMLTGNTLDIGIQVQNLDTNGEDIGIDNLGVYCTNNTACLPGILLTACNTPGCPKDLMFMR